MFGRKKVSLSSINYDPNIQKPVLRCSICTGEQVAGFKDLNTGKFQEVMVIRSEEDLKQFRKLAGTNEIEKEY